MCYRWLGACGLRCESGSKLPHSIKGRLALLRLRQALTVEVLQLPLSGSFRMTAFREIKKPQVQKSDLSYRTMGSVRGNG